MPVIAWGLVFIAALAQADNKVSLAQSSSTSGSASQRAPVPFERKVPVSPSPTAPDPAPVQRRTASGLPESAEPTDAISRGDLDRAAAKAAVEADGYKRVTIVGPRLNGAWRAKGYRGDTEVTLNVAADGSVTTD